MSAHRKAFLRALGFFLVSIELVGTAHASPVDVRHWLDDPNPGAVLRFRPLPTPGARPAPGGGVLIAGDREITFLAGGPNLVRLHGAFSEACPPRVSRRSGDEAHGIDLPLAVGRDPGSGDRVVIVPPSVASGLGDEEVEPPASFNVTLPRGCPAQPVAVLAAVLEPDEGALARAAVALRRFGGAPDDVAAQALLAPHAHVWQDDAAWALVLPRLAASLAGDGGAVGHVRDALLERALADARLADPVGVRMRPFAQTGATRADPATGDRMESLARGTPRDFDVTGQEAVRLHLRAQAGADEPAALVWRMEVRFDEAAPTVVYEIAGREPLARDTSRVRTLALSVPPGARRLRVISLDRAMAWRGFALVHKRRLEDARAPDAAGHLEAAVRAPGADDRTAFARALAGALRGDFSALGEGRRAAGARPLLAAALEIEVAGRQDHREAARLALAAAEADLGAADGGSALERAAKGALRARAARIEARWALVAQEPRDATFTLRRLAQTRRLADEDADLLLTADAVAADVLESTTGSLAVADGLWAQRPLDRDLLVARARAFALGTAWRRLADEPGTPAIAALEPLSSGRSSGAERFAFARLSPGREHAVEVPPAALPGRTPVLSVVAVRGGALARVVGLRLDGERVANLPVLRAFERFDLPVAPGRHALAIEGGDFAGEVFANFVVPDAVAPEAVFRWRRYAEGTGGAVDVARRELGASELAMVSLRLAVPPDGRVPDALDVVLTGTGGKPLALRVTPGPARPDARVDLPPGTLVTDPVDVEVPVAPGASDLRLTAVLPGPVRFLAQFSVRRRAPVAPPRAATPGSITGAALALADAGAAREAVSKLTERLATADSSPALHIARAAALVEMDELALAREDLLSALASPVLGPHQRALVANIWRSLEEIGSFHPGSAPSGTSALSPALLLSRGGEEPLGVGLLALLDDPAALATAAPAELRQRAGAGVSGDLAVLTAARLAEARADRRRAAALLVEIASAHPDLALLRREAGAALLGTGDAGRGAARAYLELHAATRLDPRDAIGHRLLRRAAARTSLRPLRFVDDSAGAESLRIIGAQALDPGVETALLPPSPDAERANVVSHERQAVLSADLLQPLRLSLRAQAWELRPAEVAATGAAPIELAWSRDGEPAQTLPCSTAAAGVLCGADALDVPAGAHGLSVWLKGGVRPVGRVWLESDRPATGLERPAASGGRFAVGIGYRADHLVARPGAPVRVAVHGPALLRVEARSRLGKRFAKDVRLLAKAAGATPWEVHLATPAARDPAVEADARGEVSLPAVELLPLEADALYQVELAPVAGEALVRLAVRDGDGAAEAVSGSPGARYRTLLPPPALLPPDLAEAPGVTIVDGPVRPGPDAGGALAVVAWAEHRQANGEDAQVQTTNALVVGAAYRRALPLAFTTVRVSGDARARSEGDPSEAAEASAFFQHPAHRWLRLWGGVEGATQPVLGSRAWSGRASFMIEPVATVVPGLHLVSKLGGWAQMRSLGRADVDEGALPTVDPAVYNRFAAAHPRGLYFEEGLESEPFANVVIYGSGRLTTNASGSPLDQDHVSTTWLARAIFGRVFAEVGGRGSWFFVDADRPDGLFRTSLFGSLGSSWWWDVRRRLDFGLWLAVHPDGRAPEAMLSVGWETSNGRRFRDHTPLEGENYFFPQREPDQEPARLEVRAP